MPEVLATTCPKCGLICCYDFKCELLPEINFTTFCIALCAIGQPLSRKVAKVILLVSLRFKSYLEN